MKKQLPNQSLTEKPRKHSTINHEVIELTKLIQEKRLLSISQFAQLQIQLQNNNLCQFDDKIIYWMFQFRFSHHSKVKFVFIIWKSNPIFN
jgi:hypothetical protein